MADRRGEGFAHKFFRERREKKDLKKFLGPRQKDLDELGVDISEAKNIQDINDLLDFHGKIKDAKLKQKKRGLESSKLDKTLDLLESETGDIGSRANELGDELAEEIGPEKLDAVIRDSTGTQDFKSRLGSTIQTGTFATPGGGTLEVGQPTIGDRRGEEIVSEAGNLAFTKSKLKIMQDQAEFRDKAGITAIASQDAKREAERNKLEADLIRVTSTQDTTFDLVHRFNQEQFRKFNIKPGAALGFLDKLIPKQWNEWKAATEAAGKEAAGVIGRFLIPGARGSNLTTIFAKSAAEIGNTLEGNAANIAASKGNVFSTAIANNIFVNDIDGNIVRIQDLIIDQRTGRPISQLGVFDKPRAVNDFKERFITLTRDYYLTKVYLAGRKPGNAQLLQPRTIVRLHRKAPNFQSIEEVDQAIRKHQLLSGMLVKVQGRLKVTK